MPLIGVTCLRCERTFVPEINGAGPCRKAPDRGPHEALPSAFMPKGYPPQDDYEWTPPTRRPS